MAEICKMFACVYAVKDGCIINGYMDNEYEPDGKKEHCPIYDVMCITAKCKACGHKGGECCPKYKKG